MVFRLSAQTLIRWIAALSALVLVVTTSLAGAKYVFCARTGTTHAHSCCPRHRVHAKLVDPKERKPVPARILRARSCCESRSLPGSNVSALELSSSAVQVPITALVADAWELHPSFRAASELSPKRWPIRAGPLEAAERCAELQVYLI
jgi:hypothetical protein